MIRSMFTAITALKLHQEWMDVVADNLANVNTPGFKGSKVLFQDMFSQLEAAGSAPTDQVGGINPTQIGLGVRIGYVTPQFVQGTLNSTGRMQDLAIQGDGFFIYKNGQGKEVYGREASLQVDSLGYLVNASTGLRLQGWNVRPGTDSTIDPNWPTVDLRVQLDKSVARATTRLSLGGNLDSTTLTNGYYDVTMGFYDSLGVEKTATVRFTRQAVTAGPPPSSPWQITVAPDPITGIVPTDVIISPDPSEVIFDEAGQVLTINGNPVGDPLIPFDPLTMLPQVTVTGTEGAEDTTYRLDLQNTTQLNQTNTIAMSQRNGSSTGAVTDIYIANDSGEIFVVYSNGQQEKLGQLAMAKFMNPSGLIRLGRSQYNEGINSGPPIVGAPNTGGRGTVNPSYLEGSNVDMGQEFTNMILAQRGFQASSRTITTADQMLQELVSLKR